MHRYDGNVELRCNICGKGSAARAHDRQGGVVPCSCGAGVGEPCRSEQEIFDHAAARKRSADRTSGKQDD